MSNWQLKMFTVHATQFQLKNQCPLKLTVGVDLFLQSTCIEVSSDAHNVSTCVINMF